jgi:hypothetical protein
MGAVASISIERRRTTTSQLRRDGGAVAVTRLACALGLAALGGTAETHVVSAMIKWVEEGAAPEKIVASRFDASGNLVRQRPVCPYPAQAAYQGSGDINSAASFACVSPKPNDRNIVEAGDLLHIRNALTQRDLELPNR